MRCAITGTAGYVGGSIVRFFRGNGSDVLGLGRRINPATTSHFNYDLTGDPSGIPWSGVDALVHCAYDFRPLRWEDIHRVNVDGSIRLLRTAREHGVKRGLFISSLSSFEGCKSNYGKAKLLIEKEALSLGFAVVRPGLVYGPNAGGMMGTLDRAARASRFLPIIGDGSYPQYLAHCEDLAKLVFLLCQANARVPSRPLSAAHPVAVSLKSLITTLAVRHGNRPVLFPIPWRLLHLGLKTLEALHLPAPFRSDSLLGIVFQNPAPDFSLPEFPDVQFRCFDPKKVLSVERWT